MVTGGSRGIGRRIAERFAAGGHRVTLAFRSGEDEATRVVRGIEEAGGRAVATRADVSNPADAAALFDVAENAYGPVDVLVHAAAVLPRAGVADLTPADLRAALDTNLLSTMLLGQQAARRLSDGGSVVNISSAITRNLPPTYAAYAASKAGLEAFTVVLARELGERAITVNAVAPGPTATEMFLADLSRASDPDSERRAIEAMSPLNRVGTPDDIADVVLDVALRLRWISGQVIHTSGGLV